MGKSSSGSTKSNPWLSIWIEPRKTIRTIIDTNPKSHFVLLSAAYGLPIVLNFAQSFSLGTTLPLWAILIASLILCVFVGMIGISVSAWLLKVTGRWIGGKGNFQEIRAAVAWSNVPSFVSIFMWAVLIIVFGMQVFNREFAEMTFVGYQAGVVFLIFLVQTVVSIWGFIILLKVLGEAQKFSAWRALFNVLIPFVIVVACVAALTWILSNIGTHQITQ